jgi:hypothetical protein
MLQRKITVNSLLVFVLLVWASTALPCSHALRGNRFPARCAMIVVPKLLRWNVASDVPEYRLQTPQRSALHLHSHAARGNEKNS